MKQHFHHIFGGWLYIAFCLFLQPSWLNWADSGIGLKDLFPDCTSLMTKLSLTVKTDDLTSNRRDIDLHRWLQVIQGRIGSSLLYLQNCNNPLFMLWLQCDSNFHPPGHLKHQWSLVSLVGLFWMVFLHP